MSADVRLFLAPEPGLATFLEMVYEMGTSRDVAAAISVGRTITPHHVYDRMVAATSASSHFTMKCTDMGYFAML
jgi:hypothetical protein